jgi:hypothetical protein
MWTLVHSSVISFYKSNAIAFGYWKADIGNIGKVLLDTVERTAPSCDDYFL